MAKNSLIDIKRQLVCCGEYDEFSDAQITEIAWAIKHGLSVEQINVFAKPCFDWSQMCELRIAFEDGLSIDQVAMFAKPELSCQQMYEIREVFLRYLIPTKNFCSEKVPLVEQIKTAEEQKTISEKNVINKEQER